MTSVPLCSIQDCEGTTRARGFCEMHYSRWRKGADMDAPPKRRKHKTCAIEGCGYDHYGLGYCARHHRRLTAGADLYTPFEERDGSQGCLVAGCNRRHEAKGYCTLHLRRFKEGRDLHSPVIYGVTGCSVPGCEKDHYSKGYCRSHYDMSVRYSFSHEDMLWADSTPCQICGRDDQPFIDHDHACCPDSNSCGLCVRGILCRWCNAGLGSFKDNPELLEGAARYLRETSARMVTE